MSTRQSPGEDKTNACCSCSRRFSWYDCRGADSRARRNAADPYRPSLKWYALPNCHCEKRSDVAISGRHLQSVQAIVKMICTPELSLRGRFAPVAISGRHLQSVQAIVKMICTPELSLRGRFAPVAISGRHLQSVQAIVKMICTPELSLRGRFAPVAISRTNFRIRRSCPVIHPDPARLHPKGTSSRCALRAPRRPAASSQ